MRPNLQRHLFKIPFIAFAISALALSACDRTPESTPESELAVEQAVLETQSASTADDDTQRTRLSDDGVPDGATAAESFDLDAAAEELGWSRVADIDADRLPPMPAAAELRSGIYSTDDGRVGVISVKYPSEGFVRPHREDIERDTFDVPRASVSHGQNLVELRSSNEAALAAAREALATRLRW